MVIFESGRKPKRYWLVRSGRVGQEEIAHYITADAGPPRRTGSGGWSRDVGSGGMWTTIEFSRLGPELRDLLSRLDYNTMEPLLIEIHNVGLIKGGIHA